MAREDIWCNKNRQTERSKQIESKKTEICQCHWICTSHHGHSKTYESTALICSAHWVSSINSFVALILKACFHGAIAKISSYFCLCAGTFHCSLVKNIVSCCYVYSFHSSHYNYNECWVKWGCITYFIDLLPTSKLQPLCIINALLIKITTSNYWGPCVCVCGCVVCCVVCVCVHM